MSSTEQKHYLDKELDPCLHFDTYIGADKTISKKELLEEPQRFLYKLFSSGSVKGETLIIISISSNMSENFVAADFFKNIILLESSDSSIKAIESWIRNEPGAVEQSHAAEFACSLKGQSTGHKKQEEKVRKAIKQVVKWDITKENPLGAVVLPQADCIVIVYHLEAICKDNDMYINLLKKLLSHLKIGGHLVMIAGINMSYYMVGQYKFGALAHNEEFMQKAVTEAGCTVVSTETHRSKFKSPLIDYESIAYFVCRKDRVV
ncbi:nicotinamide N-methyltransferase [Xenopus tropicalis]|uniref:Nicotinamide N-methyltransferase n=1 Tax=Xenopus tropicalis TaxID=8364 RepID=A0A1B8Y741_XENTR|nr:nicotinamide N-methyltransferase [Xenopus tropicalis]|eukprot:XP_012825243.1 PREDICTED: nicotinamide N-methyltransferase-like [Xenopus tropicalis]